MLERKVGRPRVLDALLVFVLFSLLVIYGVIALSSNDPFWMWPFFTAKPSKLVLYQQGQIYEIGPESPAYEPLVETLNRALSKVVGFQETLGLSEETLAEYRTRAVVLEIYYPRPVSVHSRFSFGRPNTLLIPLVGSHSEANVVFGGLDGGYWPGALTLKDLQPLKDQLAALGFFK